MHRHAEVGIFRITKIMKGLVTPFSTFQSLEHHVLDNPYVPISVLFFFGWFLSMNYRSVQRFQENYRKILIEGHFVSRYYLCSYVILSIVDFGWCDQRFNIVRAWAVMFIGHWRGCVVAPCFPPYHDGVIARSVLSRIVTCKIAWDILCWPGVIQAGYS